MIGARHIEALKGLAGEKGLLTEEADMAAYETGARYDRGRAAFVARPATTAEVSAIVSYCVRNAIAHSTSAELCTSMSGSTTIVHFGRMLLDISDIMSWRGSPLKRGSIDTTT